MLSMALASPALTTTRYALVTGANKGIGYEVCRQFASNGIAVILTARDENKGLQAIKSLKLSGLSDEFLFFHQLDVTDQTSIASLVDFVKTNFGKLDILVNNAGVSGVEIDLDAAKQANEIYGDWGVGARSTWNETLTQNLDSTEICLNTNYYGAKAMVEALAPLLQLSSSPRIINVSSFMGLLKEITNEWARRLLSDGKSLTEEKVDEVVNEFRKDFKNDLLEAKGWPNHIAGYVVAKAALNAYTRIAAKKYLSFCVICACPGFCMTDMTKNMGTLTAAQGAETLVRLALLPEDELTSGRLYMQNQIVDF